MKSLSNHSTTSLIFSVFILLIFVSYTVIRILNLSQSVQKVKPTADTPAYMRISREPIFGHEFLAGSRPFTFPLILKLLRNDPQRVVWAQGIFSIICWGVLAVSVAYLLQVSFLRPIAFCLILLLSLHRYVVAWDSVLLTESVSLSLMALFITGWLWLMGGWHWQKAVFILPVAFLWAFSRDTNGWVVLMIAVFLLLLWLLRYTDNKYLILATVFLVIFFLSNLSASLGSRWVFPFQNILGRRILPAEQATVFFANCGMPVSPALMQLAGGYANSSNRAFYEDPALGEYRLWLHQSGKACYIKWLLSDPARSVRLPLSEWNTLISMENIQPFLFSKKFSPILPARLEAIFFPRKSLLTIFTVALGTVFIAVLAKAWVLNKTWWVVIGLNLLIFPHYFIVWHGDVMGIYRHVLSVSVQFYLGIWFLALFLLDRILLFQVIQEDPIRQLFMRNAK